MKTTLLLLAALLWIESSTWGQEFPTPPPFRLNVNVTFFPSDKAPELENYVYGKFRAISGVFIVPEESADVTVVVCMTGTSRAYACTSVVMEPTKWEINGALIPVQLAPITGDAKLDEWKGQLRSNFSRLKPMYRLVDSWLALQATPQKAIDQVVEKFNVTYVEKQRRLNDQPIPFIPAPPGGWKEQKPALVVPHWAGEEFPYP